ncbi:MAG: hypothetical protein ACRCTQ_03850 [Brevinemataceae bacterium]
MKLVYFVSSVLIVTVFSLLANVIYIYILKRDLLGGIKLGFIVGTVGFILGGFFFDQLFKIPILMGLQTLPYINVLLVNRFDINFIASGFGTWFFLWLYHLISLHTER